jgi:spore coat polysaccharide biosynthesis protein SpsF (cytidylyltransferase family)
MAKKRFSLVGRVTTDNPYSINTAIQKAIPQGIIERTGADEFLVRAEFTGESARELNRSLLSELRRVEKKTRLRAEWTSGNVTEKFFDYVPKGKTRAK